MDKEQIKQTICDNIEECLYSVKLDNWYSDGTDEKYPLLDHLSYNSSTKSGKQEIKNIVEQIYFDMDNWDILQSIESEQSNEDLFICGHPLYDIDTCKLNKSCKYCKHVLTSKACKGIESEQESKEKKKGLKNPPPAPKCRGKQTTSIADADIKQDKGIEEEKIQLELWKFKNIKNAIRLSHRINNCHTKETAFDRIMVEAKKYTDEII